MRIPSLALLPFLLLPVACGGAASTPTDGGSGGDAGDAGEGDTGGGSVEDLRAHIADVMTRAEHEAEEIEVQHVLISFLGRGTPANRSQDEAEALAADVYAKVLAGDDFDGLVRTYTDDAHPGIYTMSAGRGDMARNIYPRALMADAFGDVGWRLEVGDVGVSGFDLEKSPYGWHIIKRLR